MIVFDPTARCIVLDSTNVTAAELWSRWADWAAQGENLKYPPAFRHVGGDDLGSSINIPNYYFLLNGWRVRPMEANHALTITGNLFVEGGGVPVVATLGAFNVSVQYTVPVQAQTVTVGSGLSPTQAAQLEQILALLEPDEKYESGRLKKFKKGTTEVVYDKLVTGGGFVGVVEVKEP